MALAQYDVDYSAAEAMDTITDTTLNKANVEGNTGTASLAAIFKGTLTAAALTTQSPYTSGPVGPNNNAGDLTVGLSGTAGSYVLDNPVYMSLADGSMVVFSAKAENCKKSLGQTISTWVTSGGTGHSISNCLGFIDVNGASKPNKEVNCTINNEGSSGGIAEGVSGCTVDKSAANMTDIYPIAFHDGTVEPITKAARYVLTTSK